MSPTDLHSALVAEVTKRLRIAEAATPGPWFYNSYSGVFAQPLSCEYDKWLDPLIDAGHSIERSGLCEPCGDWKEPHLAPSPGYGHGCRHFSEDYDRDPLVAHVPAHHGDTAIRRHQADAIYLEAHSPSFAVLTHRGALKTLNRHAPAIDLPELCQTCYMGDDYLPWPCEEFVGVCAVYLPEAIS